MSKTVILAALVAALLLPAPGVRADSGRLSVPSAGGR